MGQSADLAAWRVLGGLCRPPEGFLLSLLSPAAGAWRDRHPHGSWASPLPPWRIRDPRPWSGEGLAQAQQEAAQVAGHRIQ